MLALSTERAQLAVLREVIKKELSVRKTEALVKDMELGHKEVARNGEIVPTGSAVPAKPAGKQQKHQTSSSTLSDIEDSLRHLFGTQVRVKMKSNETGLIDIEFYSMEELERLLDLMMSLHPQGR